MRRGHGGRARWLCVIGAAAGLLAAGLVAAGPAEAVGSAGRHLSGWTVQVLPVLAGPNHFGEVLGTDGRETFVGVASGGAAMWRDGRLIDLGFTGIPQAVNRHGDVVGIGPGFAVLWRHGSAPVRLAVPAGATFSDA